jgi:hypothetical protein
MVNVARTGKYQAARWHHFYQQVCTIIFTVIIMMCVVVVLLYYYDKLCAQDKKAMSQWSNSAVE